MRTVKLLMRVPPSMVTVRKTDTQNYVELSAFISELGECRKIPASYVQGLGYVARVNWCESKRWEKVLNAEEV